MIFDKIYKVELDAKHQVEKECDRLKTIESIRGLLGQIDFDAEVVPVDDTDRLSRILVSLKGEPLSAQEIELLYEIAKN